MGQAETGAERGLHSSSVVLAPDRQGVGGCLSLKPQLFSSVTRCKLSLLRAKSAAAKGKKHIKGIEPMGKGQTFQGRPPSVL